MFSYVKILEQLVSGVKCWNMAKNKKSLYTKIVELFGFGNWFNFVLKDVLQITPDEIKKIRNNER